MTSDANIGVFSIVFIGLIILMVACVVNLYSPSMDETFIDKDGGYLNVIYPLERRQCTKGHHPSYECGIHQTIKQPGTPFVSYAYDDYRGYGGIFDKARYVSDNIRIYNPYRTNYYYYNDI